MGLRSDHSEHAIGTLGSALALDPCTAFERAEPRLAYLEDDSGDKLSEWSPDGVLPRFERTFGGQTQPT